MNVHFDAQMAPSDELSALTSIHAINEVELLERFTVSRAVIIDTQSAGSIFPPAPITERKLNVRTTKYCP